MTIFHSAGNVQPPPFGEAYFFTMTLIDIIMACVGMLITAIVVAMVGIVIAGIVWYTFKPDKDIETEEREEEA